MQTAINRQEDKTIELTITIPWPKVKENFDKLFEKSLSYTKVEGFRKGKAPKDLAKDKIDKEKVYQEVMREIIPAFYLHAIKEHSLQPIVSPKVELIKAKENEDWQFKAHTCEKPDIKLGDYQKAIKELKQAKRTKIWTPADGTKKPDKETAEQQKPNLNEILEAILKIVKIQIPSILLEDQVNRMLANLLDEIKKLGMTVDQYLQAKAKTIDSLKAEYKKSAEKNLSLEFILEKIADAEKIIASDQDIDSLINKEKDKKIQAQLQTQKYYLASLVRRQKTLDKLLNL
ncbi:hypothetical protein ISS85_04275 [Candidatus Microgenomates bacterium]|nr:hypothetical protein [Candidatus Microgenomates bacterium]